MKKKPVILNSLLAFAVLFGILFQYLHSYEHFSRQFSNKKCHHKYTSGKEITHQHHNFDHCIVCNLTLSSFVSSDLFHLELKKIKINSGYTFYKSREITQFFKGSIFALRAPPCFIV